eukprot:161154_1
MINMIFCNGACCFTWMQCLCEFLSITIVFSGVELPIPQLDNSSLCHGKVIEENHLGCDAVTRSRNYEKYIKINTWSNTIQKSVLIKLKSIYIETGVIIMMIMMYMIH